MGLENTLRRLAPRVGYKYGQPEDVELSSLTRRAQPEPLTVELPARPELAVLPPEGPSSQLGTQEANQNETTTEASKGFLKKSLDLVTYPCKEWPKTTKTGLYTLLLDGTTLVATYAIDNPNLRHGDPLNKYYDPNPLVYLPSIFVATLAWGAIIYSAVDTDKKNKSYIRDIEERQQLQDGSNQASNSFIKNYWSSIAIPVVSLFSAATTFIATKEADNNNDKAAFGWAGATLALILITTGMKRITEKKGKNLRNQIVQTGQPTP